MASGDRRNADSVLMVALAGGATVAAAAAQAGVGERTVWRRLQDDDFRRRLDEARQQTVATAIDYLGKASSAAAATLVELLKRDERSAVRLSAARAILELGQRLREAGELEERVASLEAALGERGRSGR